MQPDTLKEVLSKSFANATIEIEQAGSHVNILLVSDQFEGLNTVKRQQLVYQSIASLITDGTLHAVNMKTFTPGEYTS